MTERVPDPPQITNDGQALFAASEPFDRMAFRSALQTLAASGIFIGTSSWKYAGWGGQIYTPSLYEYRGRFAQSRFERDCLREYAETFRTVCVDAAYYTFPSADYLKKLRDQVPADFKFGFKVTDELTVKHYPQIPRFGARAGSANENFLNAGLFVERFLGPMESIRPNVGPIIFEFSKFSADDFANGRAFVADLDQFFRSLPKGWTYAVEMRNRNWLTSEYFEALKRHDVAHTFNSWTAMPTVTEQLALAGEQTTADISVARFLLKKGRGYEAAVKQFTPYNQTKEVNAEAREAAAELINRALTRGQARGSFLFVNNRLEGNAPNTIAGILDRVKRR